MSCVEVNQSIKPRYENLVALIRDKVKQHPDKAAYIFQPVKGDELTISYAELDNRARALAVQLDMVAEQGSRVLILCQPGIEYIISFYGCLYAQMQAVPLYPPRNERHLPRLQAVADDVDAQAVLTTTEIQEKLDRFAPDEDWNQKNKRIRVDCVEPELADYWDESFPGEDTIAFLQYTSGSTGSPKGVMVSHKNLCHNLELIGSFLPQGDTDRHLVSWLPPYHDMGLIGGLLLPAYFGYTSVTMPPESFIQRPLRWLETISRYSFAISPVPNFALELCTQKIDDEQLSSVDLSGWRAVYCGSEPIRLSTMENFSKRFSACGFDVKSLMPCYGLAEGTLMVSGSNSENEYVHLYVDKAALEKNQLVPIDDKGSSGQPLVSSGRIAGDLCVRICNPDTHKSLDENEIGEIWVSGQSVAGGYWQKPDASKESFQATLKDNDSRHYLRTGDLGFLSNGELFVTGRIKDLMIINGKNHYPQDIEYTVTTSHPGLAADACAAFTIDKESGEELVVVAEVKRSFRNNNFDEFYDAIRQSVAANHDIQISNITLISPVTLPKTSSGKIQRAQSRTLYLGGKLNILGSYSLGQDKGDRKLPQPSADTAKATPATDVDALIDWVRDYAQTRVNSRLIDERRCIPPYIALDFGEQGLMGMQIPHEYGGLGLNNQDTLRVVEQLTAVDLSLAAFVGLNNSLGIRPILHHAKDELKQEMLPRLAAGRMLASFAITEPGAGSNPRNINAEVRRINDEMWSISGEKSWIGSSAWAGVISVFAKHKESGKVTGFAMPQSTPGMHMGPEELTMGVRGMVQNSVLLDDARISDRYVLGEVGMGMDIAQETMSMTRLGFGAIGLGGMRQCAQMMHRYASRRSISTGRLLDNPISISRLNTLTLRVHALEHYVKTIAHCVDNGISVPEETLMVCKILGTEYLFEATDDLMQMLGGRGYIETNRVPQMFRDARLTRIFEGPTETLNMHVGSSMVNAPESLLKFIETQLAAPTEASRLRDLVYELRSDITSTSGSILNKVQEQQWLYSLVGEVTQWTLLRAVLESARSDSEGDSMTNRTIHWCETNLARAATRALRREGRLTWQSTGQSLTDEILGYSNIIGDLEQTASGEKTDMDELLRVAEPDGDIQEEIVIRSTVSTESDIPSDDEQTTEIKQWILHWLQTHLQLDAHTLNGDTNFALVGLDSIQAAEMMMDLDDSFGVDIDMSAAWDFPTVQDLSHAVTRLLSDSTSNSESLVANS